MTFRTTRFAFCAYPLQGLQKRMHHSSKVQAR